jgi:hypothetical protein
MQGLWGNLIAGISRTPHAARIDTAQGYMSMSSHSRSYVSLHAPVKSTLAPVKSNIYGRE